MCGLPASPDASRNGSRTRRGDRMRGDEHLARGRPPARDAPRRRRRPAPTACSESAAPARPVRRLPGRPLAGGRMRRLVFTHQYISLTPPVTARSKPRRCRSADIGLPSSNAKVTKRTPISRPGNSSGKTCHLQAVGTPRSINHNSPDGQALRRPSTNPPPSTARIQHLIGSTLAQLSSPHGSRRIFGRADPADGPGSPAARARLASRQPGRRNGRDWTLPVIGRARKVMPAEAHTSSPTRSPPPAA